MDNESWVMNSMAQATRVLTFRPRKSQPYRTSTIAPVKSTPGYWSQERRQKAVRGERKKTTFLDELVVIALSAIICKNESAFSLPIFAQPVPCTNGVSVGIRVTVEFIPDLLKLCFPGCMPIISEDL